MICFISLKQKKERLYCEMLLACQVVFIISDLNLLIYERNYEIQQLLLYFQELDRASNRRKNLKKNN